MVEARARMGLRRMEPPTTRGMSTRKKRARGADRMRSFVTRGESASTAVTSIQALVSCPVGSAE